MLDLIQHPEEARRLGEGARRYATERFNIHRFVRDWNAAFGLVTVNPVSLRPSFIHQFVEPLGVSA